MGKAKFSPSLLVISLAIAAGSFAIILGFLLVVWLALRFLHIETSLWAMIEALSTAGAASLVLGAAFVAYRELNEITGHRHLDVADRLFAEMNSTESIEARRWVLQNLPDDPKLGLAQMDEKGAKPSDASLTRLTALRLTHRDWIPEEMVMPWMCVMVVKAWTKLRPYVYYERLRRHEPDYYRYAEQVAERCVQNWRKANVPDAEVVWVPDTL